MHQSITMAFYHFSQQTRMRRLALLPGLVLLCCQLSTAVAQNGTVTDIIRGQIERISAGHPLQVGANEIASHQLLPELYERHQFEPLWSDDRTVADLLQAIKDSELDGLDPQDYHAGALIQLQQSIDKANPSSASDLANFDLLASDALIRLGYHLQFGKVDPEALDGNWNLAHQLNDVDPAAALLQAIDSGDLYQAIEALKPQHYFYGHLKSALARYREIQALDGWPKIPRGGVLKPGMTDKRIPLLRLRLSITGDLSESDLLTRPLYDANLETAVRHFQERHRLEPDGIIGPTTLAALNVPVEQRIDQLRINLERGRWVLHDLADSFIAVNIAGFTVYLIRNRELIWQTRAVVGSDFHQSPLFTADMQFLVFNPTWTVPHSIAVREMLPKIKRDPNYLRRENLRVLNSSGRPVNRNGINWAHYNAGNFPFTLRQDPGTGNALGQVKFMFPNEHSVYLHDTPSKKLFFKAQRNFSHGCIRVENPFKLAELILDDPTQWNDQSIQQTVASSETHTVHLQRPLPVLLLYWTAETTGDGTVHFMRDIYERDKAVLKALNAGFKFRRRPLRG